jgi:hypothetical protein
VWIDATSLEVKSESKNDQFRWQFPWHATVDEKRGVVYVSDIYARKIAQFSKSGEYLACIDGHGGQPLQKLTAIAVDGRGVMYARCSAVVRIFDEANHKIDDDGSECAIAIIEL